MKKMEKIKKMKMKIACDKRYLVEIVKEVKRSDACDVSPVVVFFRNGYDRCALIAQ